MAWYGLVDNTTGDLVSVGTESMFEGGVVTDPYLGYDVVEFGEQSPDFARKVWNAAQRLFSDRPPPVIISRLDDLDAWFQADADFLNVWQNLSPARRTLLRQGLRRVLARFLGASQWRGEEEQVEI